MAIIINFTKFASFEENVFTNKQMLLTKLESKGFKSFGDKILINFDEGVTGIVGQNGCGKSNVVDAIRWVLGEQSTKALRSDKMENIIFNGTKKRKPLNLSEVSLTFKNTKNLLATEYTEITITRRLYRSGDSEYLLNNVTCRLKDIKNLFLDTGIGSDSYAIIELKMIDEILNDKDNSRRYLFEEAAGISKFKIRKKETLKKLKGTDQDLERVDDLLFEIEKNLKSLEKQAKKAEKYYMTKELYKKNSITLAKKSISSQSDLFSSLNQQLQEQNDKKLVLNNTQTEKETFVEKEKANLLIKEKALASRQKALNEHINAIRTQENDKNIKKEKEKFLLDKQSSLQNQIEQDLLQKSNANIETEKLYLDLDEAQQTLQTSYQELQSFNEVLELQKEKTNSILEQANAVKGQLALKQQSVFQANKSLEVKQTQLSGLKIELEKHTTQDLRRNNDLNSFQTSLSDLLEQKSNFQELLDALQDQEDENIQNIDYFKQELETLKEQTTQFNRTLDAKKNEYKLTKSLVDNLEGYPEAIKYLQKNEEWKSNAPLFSDILTCDDAYKTVIENFLEPYINYYVVEKEKEAIAAINLLDKSNKGKAHFFVLDDFDHQQGSTSISDGIKAIDIISTDKKYLPLIQYIFDNVYIVDSITKNNQITQLTKDGKIIRRDHSINGGAIGAFEGKRIGRAKNLEKLQEDINDINSKLEAVKQESIEKRIEIEDAVSQSVENEIDEQRLQLSTLNEEVITTRTKFEQLQTLLENQADQREEIEEKITSLQEDLDNLSPETENLVEDLDILKERSETLSEELVYETELKNQRSSAFNQQNILYHQHKNRVNSLEQEVEYKQDTLQNILERLDKNESEIQTVKESIRTLNNTSEVSEEQLLAMYEEKGAIEQGVNEAEKDYYATRGEIEKAEKEDKEIQQQREMTNLLIQEIQQKINDTKLGLTSIKERLSVEFQIDIQTLMTKKEEESEDDATPIDELQAQIQKLKDTLDKIGAINPMAMETYNEMKERYDFITGQKKDLLDAKNTLLETIGQIDQVAEENFSTTFEQIRIHFKEVFRSLFSEEDTCELTLLDPENPLESGINISAKPKGKRPLTINQLSGGEKTLTAISLLFAIYLIKPAPFCIFDEVDAPLDDANVDKFTNIIRKFSEQSQFIIVTHNKRTMASTDIMYGVTMYPEDPGVSKLIPVDLRGLDELA